MRRYSDKRRQEIFDTWIKMKGTCPQSKIADTLGISLDCLNGVRYSKWFKELTDQIENYTVPKYKSESKSKSNFNRFTIPCYIEQQSRSNKGTIYVLTNTKDKNKKYIGLTIRSVKKRLYEHFNQFNQSSISQAIQQYGQKAFKVDVLEQDIPGKNLGAREKYWINKLDTFSNGYNHTKGGEIGGANQNSYSLKESFDLEYMYWAELDENKIPLRYASYKREILEYTDYDLLINFDDLWSSKDRFPLIDSLKLYREEREEIILSLNSQNIWNRNYMDSGPIVISTLNWN